ncbi:MAG: hypothetical protein PHW10_05210 [Candidatus Peribacteraceae bacterium]|nr:hypothetical protein [Candidatus Peribacteraceae bacterium]
MKTECKRRSDEVRACVPRMGNPFPGGTVPVGRKNCRRPSSGKGIPPPLTMADNGSGSGMSAIVAIVAIIVILIVGYFALQMFRGDGSEAPSVDINVPADQVVPNP